MARLTFQSLRSAAPILLGAGLFVLGLYALYHLLKPVNPADVAAQIRATPVMTLGAALAATAVGYVALVFYDWFGLRFIGRTLDRGIVALGGFLGYAFGNTIGVSVISGGAVRYRIYSAAGLNGFEVAAVSGYIAIALGTGLTLVGVAALAVHPGAVGAYLPYAPGTIQLVAGAITALSVALIGWMSATQSSLTLRGHRLRLPPPADLAGQLGVTLADIAAASFALWVLLPEGKPDYATFVAVYAAATMVGVLSHVPGGIGVFETVVIGTLPAAVPVGDAAAALLLFRLVYYLVPFALAFLLVALNEARLASGHGARLLARMPAIQPALATLHGVSPGLVAAVAFGFGVYLLLVTMLPAVRADAIAEGDLIGVLLLEGGTIAAAVAGVTLLIVSHGLARRVSSAWWFAMGALLAGAVASALSDFGLENAAVLCAGALALLPFRKAFDRPGRLTEGVFEPRWFVTVIAAAVAAAAFFFFVHKAVPYSNDLWSEFSPSSNTPRALRAGMAATALLFFFGIHLLTRPIRRKPPRESDADTRARVAAICAEADDPQAWLSQTGDKRFLLSESGTAFLMYAVRGTSWIALGDPVGDPAAFEGLLWSFADQAAKANGRPVFYEVSGRNLALWVELGLTLHKIGEEAVVRLPEFSLAGGRFKTMRAALNKRKRDGYDCVLLSPPHAAALIAELRAISDVWLGGKTGREKGFSVGRFDPDYLARFDIAVVRKEGRIVAFANILTASGGRQVAVDLMRYLPEEASGLMEYMFLSLIEHYKAQGAEAFSLGTAPLSGLSERSVARSWNRFGRLLYRHGGAFYNFEGLRAFKQKFQPEWRPRYLALPPNVSPMRAMGDVALLIAGTARGLIAK
ncbi:bifunctional lysylphosphatidylglycerol flippase/synthetase MprF [Salipiger sp. P9]|uniref:bifunctional lysylphosphatidylglycerol flippase/synthetase MprF n=1 Tax=Salipiger pentaromativorans TaxID=2943193 RepID=UPI00215807B4|nr:bifunctional lysylphosphatidylglycerol flippase/synthetase MprF [Salipiger pentaromativorans]MCR8549929.1 bifunctional lysylphosphatidylglycerol flippase/synthetase MprF [Salipiger pentaromativorans]